MRVRQLISAPREPQDRDGEVDNLEGWLVDRGAEPFAVEAGHHQRGVPGGRTGGRCAPRARSAGRPLASPRAGVPTAQRPALLLPAGGAAPLPSPPGVTIAAGCVSRRRRL